MYPKRPQPGFLVVPLLIGIGCGFVFRAYGVYDWQSQYDLPGILNAMAVAGIIGLLVGIVLDWKVTNPKFRRALIAWLLGLLTIGALIYHIIAPVVARE